VDNIQNAKQVRRAIKAGDADKVLHLVTSDNDLLTIMTPFGTWLHVAAAKGQLQIVKLLVERGLPVNCKGGVYGGGALNEAASSGHLDIVQYLVQQGAELDVSTPEANPLFGAISNGHQDIADYLVKCGIDTSVSYNGKSMKDMNALKFAMEQGEKEIAILLGATIEVQSAAVQEVEMDDRFLEEIESRLGSVHQTIHETVPGSEVSVSLHEIDPKHERSYRMWVTSGMRNKPMGFSSQKGKNTYAELLIKLPYDWAIRKGFKRDTQSFWPLNWMRKVAHMSHLYQGSIEEGVMIPNGEPAAPFSSQTDLCWFLLAPMNEYSPIKVDGKEVSLLTLIPIYTEEREFALEHGYKELLNLMNEKGITDIVNVNRQKVCL
jgi:uncharacterized protein